MSLVIRTPTQIDGDIRREMAKLPTLRGADHQAAMHRIQELKDERFAHVRPRAFNRMRRALG